jgi:predicted phosphodiesterase
MRTRSDPAASLGNVNKAAFPVRVCEAPVPLGTVTLLLDGRPLPVPQREPRRIVVLGDTGCRVKGALGTQDCNDPDAWPYAKIASHAAQARPDLVIHLGDYHYRETACPPGRDGCRGTPFGFGWDVWHVDFFLPSAPLFAAAPWLMVRGNHEDCDRAGEGWFRFLDTAPWRETCSDLTGFFVSKLGAMAFVVMDGARASDSVAGSRSVTESLKRQFADVREDIPDEAWLLTHRPMNAMRSDAATGRDSVENKLQQAAIGDELPPGVRMVVSGHDHFFQALDFGGVRPPQLVVGTGGNKLVPIPREPIVGKDVNGATVVEASARFGFGYMVWDRTGTRWEGTLFDDKGRPVEHCRLDGRRLSCHAVE